MMYCDEVLKPGEFISPIINVQKCEELLESLYDIKTAKIVELNGYDDKNYKVTMGDDSKYVLKILNSLDSKNLSFIEAQNDLLRYLGRKGCVCPQPMVNLEGTFYSLIKLENGLHVVRLMKYIPGTILIEISPDSSLFYKIGRFLGSMNKAMKDFQHSGYHNRTFLWSLEAVPKMRGFIGSVDDEGKRKRLEKAIRRFEEEVLPEVPRFEKGLIHGDFNEQNIVLSNDTGEWEVGGILDFGDSHYSCYLFELGVALTYMMIVGQNFESAGYFLAGYMSEKMVSEEEIRLLKTCIMGRLCQSLIMGAYSIQKYPDNVYLLATAVPGWNLFKLLEESSDEELLSCWKAIINKSVDV